MLTIALFWLVPELAVARPHHARATQAAAKSRRATRAQATPRPAVSVAPAVTSEAQPPAPAAAQPVAQILDDDEVPGRRRSR
jgi:hypothetical protein